jgi:hypothetical protein
MPLRKIVPPDPDPLADIQRVLDNAEKDATGGDVPRVGKFFADYSAITPEEIAEVDSECAELFKHSKPVSR